MTAYREVSFWHDSLDDDDLVARASLPGDAEVDVAIVGAGLTGLWTAWYLLDRDPGLRITILEKEIAGFGASGRNGGWCSALFPRSTASLERTHGREAALAMRRAMIDTIDEVGEVTERAGIACDFRRGGTVAFARSAVQLDAARAEVDEARAFGVDQLELWGPSRVRAAGALGASYDPACARLHPAKLVRGLARAVESRGAQLAEHTEVLEIAPGRVTTAHGTVRAERVVQATEGYGAGLASTHRRILPLYSLMVATEPLAADVWEEIGLAHGQTFSDYRHLLIYGQRTADDRIAFGGRGARYHLGSAIRPDYDRVPHVFEHLRRALVDLFPVLDGTRITHRWGGPLGVPRDWHARVNFSPTTGLASAGGYVGDGLSTTNLAGRTLADLLTGHASELTRLPWVGHTARDWEPEPWRFLGANAGLLAMQAADAEERLTQRRSIIARAMGPLVGH